MAPTRAEGDRALFERYQDARDPVDRDHLVDRFLPLARRLASRYSRGSEPFDDLFQVACLGLVKAIDRFDLDRGVAFSSYALPTIVGELKRHLRDHTWSVHVPRDLLESALSVDRIVAQLARDLHRQPTIPEIAARAGRTAEQVLEALEASRAYHAISLEVPRDDDDETGETLGATLGLHEEGFAGAEDRATLEQLTSILTDRERRVLHLRFERDLTQAEIGALIGVSQMQVSRILRRSLAQLHRLAVSPANPA